MGNSWATYGIDLHLEVAGSRVRAGLESSLREAARTGRLRPGVRLPSSRDLAADLAIARNTVAEAYGQLIAEGWLTARTGSGTWVSERPAAQAEPSSQAVTEPGSPRYDLRAGAPAVSAFPRREWLAAARAALRAAGDGVLDYPDPRGLRELRVALAGYLARARGVIASPERVVICGGFSHGLALICRMLSERGASAIATEWYGHQAHRLIARAQRLETVPLAVDARGAVTDAGGLGPTGGAGAGGPGGPGEVGAVLLTPAHQFPLGVTLAPGRRTAFVTWAARTGGVLIEDDYDGEFRYDRQPVGAMQALAPEHVVYAGTASKSLAPGLRLGWLVVPTSMVDELIAVKDSFGMHNGALDQLALARLIDSGGYDRQIRQARLVYRRRRDRLIAALERQAPRVRLSGIAAGQHAVAELPVDAVEEDIVTAAADRGVTVEGLGRFAAADHHRGPALVIGYGRPAEHAFTTAVGRLCAALAEAT